MVVMLDLEAINARYAQYGPKVQAGTAVADVRALLAEVERLRRELASAKGAHREDMREAREELREAQDRQWHNDRIGW